MQVANLCRLVSLFGQGPMLFANLSLFENLTLLCCFRDNMGYPIVECAADGKFIISKPPNTGGVVSPLTVAEQVLWKTSEFVHLDHYNLSTDPLQCFLLECLNYSMYCIQNERSNKLD